MLHAIEYGGTSVGSDRIISFSSTHSVNNSTDLTLGSCCAASLNVTIRGKGLKLPSPGGKMEAWEIDNGVRYLLGIFNVDEVKRASAEIYRITAYDNVSLLEKNASDFIDSLTFPTTVYAIAKAAIEKCGLHLVNPSIPNGDRAVKKFRDSSVTFRGICTWVGEVSGTYCHALPEGGISFDWYKNSNKVIGNAQILSGSLSQQSYKVERVKSVQARLSDSDVGVSYPAGAPRDGVYQIVQNFLAIPTSPNDRDWLKPVYDRISTVSYTPTKVKILADPSIKPGDIIAVSGFTVYVMSITRSGHSETISCTGNRSRSSVSAVAGSQFKSFEGRLFESEQSIEGLSLRATEVEASNAETIKKVSELTQTVGGFETRVSQAVTTANGAKEAASSAKQTADSVSVEVKKKVDSNTGSWDTFGFVMDADHWTVTANNKLLLYLSQSRGLEIHGKVYAEEGEIGNMLVRKYNPDTNRGGYLKVADAGNAVYIGPPNKSMFDKYVILAGPDDDIESHQKFRVTTGGKMICTEGEIGGWDIDATSIFKQDTAANKNLVMSVVNGLYGGTTGKEWHIRQDGSTLFKSVEAYGDIYANNGYFKGTVYAGNISYGGDSGYVSGKCLSNNSVTTVETSTGINDSLGYANFSDDVFHERATAPAIKAIAVFCSNYWSGKHLLKEKSVTIGGQTINYMSWT